MLFDLPGYQLLEEITKREDFSVYRGERSQDRLPVLVKVLNQPYSSPLRLDPLLQEFEILRLLDLTGVDKAHTLEYGPQGGAIVLEDFGGQPLDQLELAGRMDPGEFLELALQLAGIVEGIHARNIIHKTISPANIYFNLAGRQARLVNFSQASWISNEKSPASNINQPNGSLAYISPEMTGRMNRPVDYRSDYYSLGATLYELLTGNPPFPEQTALELVHAHLASSPEPPASRMEPWKSSPAAFSIISAILLKLLEKNPEDRYQTAAGLLADLRQCRNVLEDPSQIAAKDQNFIPGQVDQAGGPETPPWMVKDEQETDAVLQTVENQQKETIAASIDLNTILEASLELAQETSLEQLLRKLMTLLIENAGAQNGTLVLWLDQRWFLEVQGSSDPEQAFTLLSIPLEEQATQLGGPQVPAAIIQHVIHSRESLVLSDACASHEFSQDEYIQIRRPRSVLCAPLVNQGVLSGVAYLENNLVTGAFTPERLQIVQLISSQAAVSIEKARLYESLEALVEERTLELSKTNRQLEAEIQERIRVEEALRLSEERYRTIFDSTGTAMLVVDKDGRTTLFNEEFVRLTGYPRETLEDDFQSMDLVAPEDVSRLNQYRRNRLKDPSTAPQSYEFRLIDRSGSEKTILNTATVLPGSRTVIISMNDISQLMKAEDELQKANEELVAAGEELRRQYDEQFATLQDLAAAQETIIQERQRYQNLFDFAPDAYFVTDRNGKIIEANQAAAGLLGVKVENLPGRLLVTFFAGEERKVLRNRLVALSAGKAGYRDWETSMQTQDGIPFDAAVTVATVPGEPGASISLRWMVRDINARKRAERALLMSEERLRSITENAPDFIAELDLQGHYLYVNRAFEGRQPGTSTGVSIFVDIPAEYHDDIRKMIENVIESREVQAAEFRQRLADGSERWLSSRMAPIAGPDGIQHIVLISTDVTKRKEIERLLHENEARLRLALDSAQLAPFEYNLETGELVWEDRTRQVWGLWNGESPDYAGAFERVHPEDRQVAERAMGQAADPVGSGDIDLEFRLVWPDGQVRWISAKGKMSFEDVDGQRQATRILGILRDKTHSKLAAEALRYNEALLRKVMEALPVGVWIIDESSRIMSGNPESQRIWAGAKYVPSQEYGVYKAWRVATGERVRPEEWAGALALTQGQITLNEELEIEAFDGTHRFILNSAMPIEIEEDRFAGAIVVNQDITLRKRYEQALQLAHDQLASLLQISQTILFTLDLDPLLHLIIDQLEKVLPYDGAAILTIEQDFLEFQVIRGPSIFEGLSKVRISVHEPTLIEPLLKEKETFYLADLQTEEELLGKFQQAINMPVAPFAHLRSWLGVPLIARDELVGIMVLAHTQPNYYPLQMRILSRAFANHVALAIHNARLYKRAHEVAALEERTRLARELHDSVAQALYSISLFTDATRLALEASKLDVVKNHLGELVELSREAMSDMRLMIFELRPPVLEKDGLASALQSRLDSVESRAGFQTTFLSDGEYQLSADQESELYRIAQEALNNVLKHARANRVIVLMLGETGSFKLVIEDDGVGFDPATAGMGGGQGIRNIHERAEQIGAKCWVESAPSQGTRITIEVNR